MRCDLTKDEFAKCRSCTHGPEAGFVVDFDLGQPFGTAGSQVREIDDVSIRRRSFHRFT